MKNFIEWTKANKFATVVIFVLLLIVLANGKRQYMPFMKMQMYGTDSISANYGARGGMGMSEAALSMDYGTKESMIYPPTPVVAPNLSLTERKVITEGSLSLQVDSINETIDDVKAKVSEFGGYIVNTFINRPEFGESATVSVRVPSDKVESFMDYARSIAVKVVNENTSGSDITDQYVDLEERLGQLEEQKAKLEAILRSATTVQDIIAVQPYINQVQNEIDSLKGQTGYMDAASKSSLITLYLSTDELSLPYTPERSWRPQVIFKNAVRSLIEHVQLAGTALIWLAVYSAIIVPALTVILVIYLLVKRRRH